MIIDRPVTRAGVERATTGRPGPRFSPMLPALAMLAVAVTWGVAVSVVDVTADRMPAADLVAWRFGIAAVALLLVRSRAPRMPAALRIRGILLGSLLGLGFLLQTWAITDTDAMMAGFLTGTLVVMAPAIGWALFRVRPARATWIGVAVATLGLALLSVRGAGFGRGELLTLLAAAVWALHLVLLARWGRPTHALQLARVQTAAVAAIALLAVVVGGAATGGPMLPAAPSGTGSFLAVLFLALPATAAAMVALSWAQPRMSAARAGVLLTLEPAAAAATAAVLGAALGGRMILGGLLLIGAMLIVELGGPRATNGRQRAGAHRKGDRKRTGLRRLRSDRYTDAG